MKKYLLLIFSTVFSALSFGQDLPVDSLTKKVTFSEAVVVQGATKDVLFTRAKNLNMIRENVKADNKAEGTYSYKGKINVNYPAPQPGLKHAGTVSYVVTIFVKDGKYKYIISDFVHESDKGNGGKLEGKLPECNKYVLSPAGWAEIKRQTKTSMEKLINSIKLNMNPVSEVPKNTGDW